MQSHERNKNNYIDFDWDWSPWFPATPQALALPRIPGNLQASQFNTYILSNGGEKYKKTNKIKLTKEKENKEISSGNNFFF